MDKFIIQGPTPLRGSIRVSGSKNAALPLMAAALLTEEPCTLDNIPRLQDIHTFAGVMRGTGTAVDFNSAENRLTVDASHLSSTEAPYDLVRKMRASFYMLGALAGRAGKAKVSLPGGCAWGPRPVDLHLKGLEAMGFTLEQEAGYILLSGPERLARSSFHLQPSSVGATVNLILAAVLRSEEFTLSNAAIEPDVVQLCRFLQDMGADIEGVGTPHLTIRRVDSLKGVDFRNAADRIEAGTFIIAAAMHPDSDLLIEGVEPGELGEFLTTFRQTGAQVSPVGGTSLRVIAPNAVMPVSVQTAIYPGFPTDLQAQWATLMTQAFGKSVIEETIYTDRFSYVPELMRLGAALHVRDHSVWVSGSSRLSGASGMSTDLRASVSLVMAGMIAEGTTEVLRVYHLDRGYEDLEKKLNAVGASIQRAQA